MAYHVRSCKHRNMVEKGLLQEVSRYHSRKEKNFFFRRVEQFIGFRNQNLR